MLPKAIFMHCMENVQLTLSNVFLGTSDAIIVLIALLGDVNQAK